MAQAPAPAANQTGIKTFQKGDHIYRDGDKITHLYIIQSGLVSVYLPRLKKSIELYQATNAQILGEAGIIGVTTHSNSAVALNETKALEVPIELIQPLVANSHQILKLILKSIGERMKTATNELKQFKLEKDSTPCPPDLASKIFASLYHTLNHTGKKEPDGKVTIQWQALKQYSQRLFLEPPNRTEQTALILVKMKMASFERVKDGDEPDAPETYGKWTFDRIDLLERFFEFYQHTYFKGGDQKMLKSDDQSISFVTALLKATETDEPDRNGVLRVNFKDVTDKIRALEMGNFSGDFFSRIETKGLFAKRETTDKGVFISFHKPEFQEMILNWKILAEIEKWNEKGFVDLDEGKPKKGAKKLECPSCAIPFIEKQKFCGNCGGKLPDS